MEVNNQLGDASEKLTALLGALPDSGGSEAQTFMVHAIGLAMLNAVSQQQQLQILQNAVTAVAARVVLEQDPQAALAMMRELTAQTSIVETLNGLCALMEEVVAKRSGASRGADSGSAAA